jgi:transcriptional regulator with XRE-family HTH domain
MFGQITKFVWKVESRRRFKLSSIGERVKEIRKALKLSQQKFGAKLKVSKSHISNIELGGDYPSDMLIKLFCIEFGINEEWLKYGTGEKYICVTADKEETINIDNYVKQIYDNHKKYLRIIALLAPGEEKTDRIQLEEETDLINIIGYLQYRFSQANDDKEKLRIVIKFENAFNDYLEVIEKLNVDYAQYQKKIVNHIKEFVDHNEFFGPKKAIEAEEKVEQKID